MRAVVHDEILVDVHATVVTRTNCGDRATHPVIMRRHCTGLRRPQHAKG